MSYRRPVYIVMAGLPASGKSTLRRALVRDWWSILYQLSTDDIIDKIAEEERTTYSDVFLQEIEGATQRVKQDRRTMIAARVDIIHDQTNVTYNKRKGLIADLPGEYLKVCVPVHTNAAVRRMRLGSRPGKVIPPHIDSSMVNSWQTPILDEGFDVIVPPYLVTTALRPYFV